MSRKDNARQALAAGLGMPRTRRAPNRKTWLREATGECRTWFEVAIRIGVFLGVNAAGFFVVGPEFSVIIGAAASFLVGEMLARMGLFTWHIGMGGWKRRRPDDVEIIEVRRTKQ